MSRWLRRLVVLALAVSSFAFVGAGPAGATTGPKGPTDPTSPTVTIDLPGSNGGSTNTSVVLLLVLTVISVAPAILLLTTSFTKIVVVHGVCSLDAIALEAVDRGGVATPFAVATDARRREVYVATYDAAGRRTSAPQVHRPADLPNDLTSGPVAGEGAWLYADVFGDPREPRVVSAEWLAAYAVARLRAGDVLDDTTPLYLRRPDAVENVGRKRVTPT